MSRVMNLEPEFVEEIPAALTPGKLYVSVAYGTVMHLCACGCGSEVSLSLHPERWALTYDGETVSMWPSVGSWDLPCQSHYVIERNQLRWLRGFSKEKIEAVREKDREALAAYHENSPDDPARDRPTSKDSSAPESEQARPSLLRRLLSRR